MPRLILVLLCVGSISASAAETPLTAKSLSVVFAKKTGLTFSDALAAAQGDAAAQKKLFKLVDKQKVNLILDAVRVRIQERDSFCRVHGTAANTCDMQAQDGRMDVQRLTEESKSKDPSARLHFAFVTLFEVYLRDVLPAAKLAWAKPCGDAKTDAARAGCSAAMESTGGVYNILAGLMVITNPANPKKPASLDDPAITAGAAAERGSARNAEMVRELIKKFE